MENRKGKNTWKSVPEFGGWDQKDPSAANYSMVFSQARADRKQKKTTINRSSLGNEQELNPRHHQDPAVVRKPKAHNYFNCCIRP